MAMTHITEIKWLHIIYVTNFKSLLDIEKYLVFFFCLKFSENKKLKRYQHQVVILYWFMIRIKIMTRNFFLKTIKNIIILSSAIKKRALEQKKIKS